jgi:hypothetical protein
MTDKSVTCSTCHAIFWVSAGELADGLASGTFAAAERYVRAPEGAHFLLDRYVAGLCYRCHAPEPWLTLELQLARINTRRAALETFGLDRENAIGQAVREEVEAFERAHFPDFAEWLRERALADVAAEQ